MKVIMDTCILHYFMKDETKFIIRDCIRKIRNSHHLEADNFYISDISRFELLRGANKILPITQLLESIQGIELSREILTISAFLFSACQSLNNRQIQDDGDCLIGGTSFSKSDSYIFTADGDGFPKPFFHSVGVFPYRYLKGGRVRHITFYLLTHDWNHLTQALAGHRV